MRKALALSTLILVALASNVFGAEAARMSGKITDAQTKQPIPDAVIKVEAVEGKTVKFDQKAKKDGSYALMVMTGTIRYKFTWTAPGYDPHEETLKLNLLEPNIKDIQLTKTGAAPTTATIPAGEIKVDPAVAAYNDGAALANSGDAAGAAKKFEEAVAAKPDMVAGWNALAKMSVRTKNYARAIEAANKVLEIDPDEAAMYSVLADAYTATGDKAKAAEARKKLPADASSIYNEAAKAINAGKDGEAEPLLKQVLAADENYAAAHYELGMLYARASKNAEARQHLTKYLELEPKGKDAALAKEMLNYIK
ncbi:MAG TPA: tetratricopeptide repeat protein [Thermoanaerobaculia bacterium]